MEQDTTSTWRQTTASTDRSSYDRTDYGSSWENAEEEKTRSSEMDTGSTLSDMDKSGISPHRRPLTNYKRFCLLTLICTVMVVAMLLSMNYSAVTAYHALKYETTEDEEETVHSVYVARREGTTLPGNTDTMLDEAHDVRIERKATFKQPTATEMSDDLETTEEEYTTVPKRKSRKRVLPAGMTTSIGRKGPTTEASSSVAFIPVTDSNGTVEEDSHSSKTTDGGGKNEIVTHAASRITGRTLWPSGKLMPCKNVGGSCKLISAPCTKTVRAHCRLGKKCCLLS